MIKRYKLPQYLVVFCFSIGFLSGCLTTKDVKLAVESANAEIEAATFTDPAVLMTDLTDLAKDPASAETALLKAIQKFQQIGQAQETPSINTKAAIAALQLRLTVLYIVTDRYNLAKATADEIEQSDFLSQTQRTLAGLTTEYATWRKVTKPDTKFRVCDEGQQDEDSSNCLDWNHYPKSFTDAQKKLVTVESSTPVLIINENNDVHAFLTVWKGRVGTLFVKQRSQVMTSAQAVATSKRLSSVIENVTPYITRQQIKDLNTLCKGEDLTLQAFKRTQQLKNMMVSFDELIEKDLVNTNLSQEDNNKLTQYQFKTTHTKWFDKCVEY